MDKLTPKQERFCREYVIDLNGTQAAIRAGYSTKSAKEQSSENLTKTNIKERINTLQEAKQKKIGIKAEDVVNGFKAIAENKSEETSDRLRAYENLGKYLGLFEKDNAQKTTNISLDFGKTD